MKRLIDVIWERHLLKALIVLLILLNLYMLKTVFSLQLFALLKKVIFNTVVPFLVSFIIVYIFRPILLWIERKSHIKTWVSTFLFMGFLLISFIIFIELFIPLLLTQISNLIRELPHYKEQFIIQLSEFESQHKVLQEGVLSNLIDQFLTKFTVTRESNSIRIAILITKKTFNVFWMATLVPVIMFMMVKDYDLILKSCLKLVPKKEHPTAIQLAKNIDTKLGLYIRGQLLVFTYMFVGSFALFSLVGLKHSFLFAVVFAMTNFIPYLGPYLGGIPVSIYAYLQSTNALIFVLLIIFFLQQFDGDIGQPVIFGKQLNLHPLVIIICMAIGSVLFGVIGLLIAIPVFIILKEIYLVLKLRFVNHKQIIQQS